MAKKSKLSLSGDSHYRLLHIGMRGIFVDDATMWIRSDVDHPGWGKSDPSVVKKGMTALVYLKLADTDPIGRPLFRITVKEKPWLAWNLWSGDSMWKRIQWHTCMTQEIPL